MHYDFGLRAILKSVSSAKALKLLFPDEKEVNLVCDALRTQHFGKLTEEDISVFAQVMEEVFPGNQLLMEKNEEFKRIATEITKSLELKVWRFINSKSYFFLGN